MNWKAIRRDHQGQHVCLRTPLKVCDIGNPQPKVATPRTGRRRRWPERGTNFEAARAKFERIHAAKRQRNLARGLGRLTTGIATLERLLEKSV